MVYTKTVPVILKIFFPDILWSVPAVNGKSVYLTFDDGPDPEITPWVLDMLSDCHSKATFFCLGKNVEAYPDIYREILARGHSVGIHGYEHLHGWKTTKMKYLENLDRCKGLIDSGLFRPPYGKLSLAQYIQIRKKYRIVLWDLMPGDFMPKRDPEKLLDYTIKNLKNGSIITLHDNPKSRSNLKALLPPLLDYFKQHQFELRSLRDV